MHYILGLEKYKSIYPLLGLLSRVFRGKLALFISAYAYVTCFSCDLYCGYGSVPTTWILAIAGDGNMCIYASCWFLLISRRLFGWTFMVCLDQRPGEGRRGPTASCLALLLASSTWILEIFGYVAGNKWNPCTLPKITCFLRLQVYFRPFISFESSTPKKYMVYFQQQPSKICYFLPPNKYNHRK